jgi:hypothetical protein
MKSPPGTIHNGGFRVRGREWSCQEQAGCRARCRVPYPLMAGGAALRRGGRSLRCPPGSCPCRRGASPGPGRRNTHVSR